MIFSLAHWTEAAWVTQGQQGLSSGPSPGCGGTIHLAQLPPYKPYSVATSIPRAVTGVASDMETESILLKRQEDPWASWARPLGASRSLHSPSAQMTPALRYLLWKYFLPSGLRLAYSLWTLL